MTRRTLSDKKDKQDAMDNIVKHGQVPGYEDYNHREILDPRPMAPPVRRPHMAPSPLDQMYMNIRAQIAGREDHLHEETPEEAADFEVPEEVEELLSQWEERWLPGEDHPLGEALKDPAVQNAIKAALEGRYGLKEAAPLRSMAAKRSASSAAPPAPSLAPAPGGPGPGSTGEGPPPANPPKAG